MSWSTQFELNQISSSSANVQKLLNQSEPRIQGNSAVWLEVNETWGIVWVCPPNFSWIASVVHMPLRKCMENAWPIMTKYNKANLRDLIAATIITVMIEYKDSSRPTWPLGDMPYFNNWMEYAFLSSKRVGYLLQNTSYSLWPRSAIWWHRTLSKFVQVMACYLTARTWLHQAIIWINVDLSSVRSCIPLLGWGWG